MEIKDAKIGMRVGLCGSRWLAMGGNVKSFDYYFHLFPLGEIVEIYGWGIMIQSLKDDSRDCFSPQFLAPDE